MISVIATYFNQLLDASSVSLKYSQKKLVPLCWLVIVCFPLYYFIWQYVWPQPYENLPLRLIGALSFFILLFTPTIHQFYPKLTGLIWFSTFTYAIAFFFQFMLLKNHISSVWIASTMIGILLMSVICYGRLMLYSMYIIGTALACLFFYYTEPTAQTILLKFLGQLPIQGFCLLFVPYLDFRTEQVIQEKMASYSMAGSIAHELKTPLGLMMSYAQLSQGLLPTLPKEMPLQKLEIQLNHICHIGSSAIQLADLITHSMKGELRKQKNDVSFSAQDLLKETIEEYFIEFRVSYHLKQKIFLVADQNFYIQGSKVLFSHIIFNLLKNSVYYIEHLPKNKIEIHLITDWHSNKLIFKDYGPGIEDTLLATLFDSTSSTTKADGTGLGLPFCKRAMEAFSGDILCDTKQGEYTAFILVFPKVK